MQAGVEPCRGERQVALLRKRAVPRDGPEPDQELVGREAMPPGGEADESLLIEAEALAEEAMRAD